MESTWNNIIELRELLNDMLNEYWINETLFTFNWWLLLTVTIGLTITWWILLDKQRIIEILLYGFTVSITASFSDLIGIHLMAWAYPYSLEPFPAMFEIHILSMPIIYMLVYQFFTRWKSFFIAIVITAFTFAFILEPLLIWLGIYEVYGWHHIYSFPNYILIGVFFKWLVNKLKQMDKHY
jgi:hypothetical protein